MTIENETATKICFKCGLAKTRSCFYKHGQMGDGLMGKCKDCTKLDVKAHREANIDYVRQYDKARAALPERVEARKLYSQTASGKASGTKAKNQWRRNNRIKALAISKANYAVLSGKLQRQTVCEKCGTNGRMHKHHDDYSKPLAIRWLCAMCHTLWHKENGEGKF